MSLTKQQEIFVAAIDAHKGILYRIINTYCKDAEDRKDLSQEIVLKLWRSFENFDPQFRYSTWMYKIALNTAISWYRKEKRRNAIANPYTESIFMLAATPDNPDTATNDTFLLQFISELKELDKALMLLYLEEKTHKEMGDILGITETNIATKISRIKSALQQRFSQITT